MPRSPLARLLAVLVLAPLATSTAAGAQDATTGAPAPSPAVAEPPVDTSMPGISPELAAVPVDGDAADEAAAAYARTAAALAAATATRDRAGEELVRLAEAEVTLTLRIAEATATRKAATVALMEARRRVQAAAVSSYVAEAGADELTRVVDAGESVAIGRVRTYADTVRADRELAADDAQAVVDRASATILAAERQRRAGRARAVALAAARDEAAAEVDRLGADLELLADDQARIRATSRVTGADFTLVALDAYWRAAASQADCGISWWALAAVSRVEGRHGQFRGSRVAGDGQVAPPIVGIPLDGRRGTRLIPDSDDGALDGDLIYDRAVGPMQFIPTTWARWAADGDGDGDADPQNLYDAAAAAAAYLCRGRDLRTEEGLRAAFFSYNRSDSYVDTVLAHAEACRQLELALVPPS